MASQTKQRKESLGLPPTRSGRGADRGSWRSHERCVKPALLRQLWMKQLVSRDLQRLRNQCDVVDGDIPDPLFEASNESPVQSALEGKLFLRQLSSDACHAHVLGKYRAKGRARGLFGGRSWHPTDGWKKTCLKPRCLNIIRKLWRASDWTMCESRFVQKRYLNTTLKLLDCTSRASDLGK